MSMKLGIPASEDHSRFLAYQIDDAGTEWMTIREGGRGIASQVRHTW